MPYIPKEDRVKLDAALSLLSLNEPGHVNYLITKICHKYLNHDFGWYTPGHFKVDYARHNEVIGVLECAKLEFYRMQTAKYEEEKRRENGDI